MKAKIILVIISAFILTAVLAGCSSANKDFTAEVILDNKIILSVDDKSQDELKAVTADGEKPLFKEVTYTKNKGLYYNAYTFKATTNISNCKDDYRLTVTLPGSITQTKDGTVKGKTVTFNINDFTKENEFAVYSDSNNYAVVIGIIVVLVAILGGFIFFAKKKG